MKKLYYDYPSFSIIHDTRFQDVIGQSSFYQIRITLREEKKKNLLNLFERIDSGDILSNEYG